MPSHPLAEVFGFPTDNMKVQAISKHDLLKMASQFEDMENREKVLRIVHDEFRREYESRIG